MKAKMLITKQSITSRGKMQKIYAQEGQTVTVINDFGNVVVVECEKGNRFPVGKHEIQFIVNGNK